MLGIPGAVPLLELAAYGGYPFAGACACLVAHMCLGTAGYHVVWAYASLCMAVFTVRSLKRVLYTEARVHGEAGGWSGLVMVMGGGGAGVGGSLVGGVLGTWGTPPWNGQGAARIRIPTGRAACHGRRGPHHECLCPSSTPVPAHLTHAPTHTLLHPKTPAHPLGRCRRHRLV